MSTSNNDPLNPSGICTWQDISQCTGCPITGRLKCRFNWSDLSVFLLMFLPPAIAAVAGMFRAGFGWFLLGWVGFAAFFFFVWEARVLCSHCPFWAREGRVLHCLANHGVIKIWRYHPEPMSRAEQIQFLIGALIIVAYPFPFLVLGGEYLLALIMASGMLAFGWNLKHNVCTHCVNFSCPLNGVPKAVVDAYLRQNPVMREGWEKSGYQLGD